MQTKDVIEIDRSLLGKCVPFVERPTCSIAEACQAVGCGRTELYALTAEGHIQTVKIGRRRFVRVPSLLSYLSEPLTKGLEPATFSAVALVRPDGVFVRRNPLTIAHSVGLVWDTVESGG